ncbi:TonB-dependent receptor [bacterium]|nr:MAG: TonB-dependent receptor [bacterium]
MRSLITLLFVLCVNLPLFAQSNGKISGMVKSDNGEPLPGVQVVIDGTTLGTITDFDGYYSIIAVPAGTHTLKFKYIGFADVTVNEVRVIKDRTTEINATMRETVIEGEEITITADRPIVQKDRTTTTAFIDQEQLENLPALSIAQVINLQAGVIDGSFRGGALNEVTYMVNGVPINNPYTNTAGFEVEQNMISNLEVITGVFNAEYGQATSGVVNIETKSAPAKWSVSALSFARGILSDRPLYMLKRTSDASNALGYNDFTTEKTTLSEAASIPNRYEANLSIGGPLIKEKLGVNVSARYINDSGYLVGRNVFNPSDFSGDKVQLTSSILNNPNNVDNWLIESTGDNKYVMMDQGERTSLNTSLTYFPFKSLKLEYNLFYQDAKNRYYSHNMKYVPDGRNWNYASNLTQIVSARFTFGKNTFANFTYSHQVDDYTSRLYGDPTQNDSLFDARLQPSAYATQQGSYAYDMGGNDLNYANNSAKLQTFAGSVTSQINKYNQVKTGFQLQYQNIKNNNIGIDLSSFTNYNAIKTQQEWRNTKLNATPIQFAYYLQNKTEFQNLIINAGVRLDYFDARYDVPIYWSQASFDRVENPLMPGDSISNRQAATAKYQISPRLAVAFPISASGVIRFSYGMFFQVPNYSDIYRNPEYDVNTSSESTGYGNPDILPQKTSTFEIGLQQGLTDKLGMELTLYTKDVRNLLATQYERNVVGASQAAYLVNRDYGTVRGFTLSIFQRPFKGLSWNIDYTLQYVDGSYAVSGEQLQRYLAGLNETLVLARLDWDRRHVLNNQITYEFRKGLTVSVVNRLLSGRPYTTTRNFVTSFIPNNDDRPFQITTDMRVFYKPEIIKQDVELFLQVDNLFDFRRDNGIYGDSGTATETPTKERLQQQIDAGQTRILGVTTLDDWFYRQDFFGAPRMVSIGLNIKL